MKLLVTQVAQRLFAEQVMQLVMLQVTQDPVELTVRLFEHCEQKLLALHKLHCWTLQLAQTVPFWTGLPEEQLEQLLVEKHWVHPVMLQSTQTPDAAVKGALQVLHWLLLTQD